MFNAVSSRGVNIRYVVCCKKIQQVCLCGFLLSSSSSVAVYTAGVHLLFFSDSAFCYYHHYCYATATTSCYSSGAGVDAYYNSRLLKL